MKRMITVILLGACLLLSLCSCGKVTEQNNVTLQIKTMGTREGNNTNDGKEYDSSKDAVLITGARVYDTIGVVNLTFPLGLQDYEFSAFPSVYSKNNEALTASCIGGTVTFNVLFHMYINRDYPDLKERLLRFVKAYQLLSYNGSDDVLAKLMSGRLRDELFKPFIDYCANKTALEIIRDKELVNITVLAELNKKFNQYGLNFTVASISSAITVSKEQQDKLNQMVIEDAELQTAEFRNKNIKPLDEEIVKLNQVGDTEKARLINEAKAKSIAIVSQAEQGRRDKFIKMIGRDNYVRIENMMTMVNNLKKGNVKVEIVPQDSKILIDRTGASAATVAKSENTQK